MEFEFDEEKSRANKPNFRSKILIAERLKAA